jgi:anti-sigma factor RsiW
MICRHVIAILDGYVDGELPADLAAEIDRHLAGCEPCRAFLATYRATRRLGAVAGRIEMPEEMQTRLRAFLAGRSG